MAYFRISELPVGPAPVPANSLLEVSVVDATTVSGFDSYQIPLSQLFTDITLAGNIYVPTYPPGTNSNLVASTQYVANAVNTSLAYVEGNFLRLTGGTLSGALVINATLNVSGYTMVGDFRSNANVYAPNGFVHSSGDITTDNTYYTASVGDPGARTDYGSFNGHFLRFRVNAGDENNSASINYRVHDAGALCIVGAGTSSTNRRVKLWDHLDVARSLTVYGNSYFYDWADLQNGSHIRFNAPGQYNASGNYLDIYDDGNSNIRSNSALWLTITGPPGRPFGAMYINADIYAVNHGQQSCGISGKAWLFVTAFYHVTVTSLSRMRDVAPVADGALALVEAVKPKTYTLTDDPDAGRRRHGFFADDIRDALGDDFGGLVRDAESGEHALDYAQLTTVLWAGVRELSAKVRELESRI